MRVGHRLGGQVLHRALGRALAVDKLVVGDALLGQEVADKAVVLGGDPQPETVCSPKGRGGGVEIVERVDVAPAGRNRDDKIGPAEAERGEFGDLPVPVGQLVADQIRAGHAQMDAARRQFARDFPGGEKDKLQPVRAFDGAGIFAVGPGAAERDAAACEPVEALLHQPALRGDAKLDHARAPFRSARMPGRMTPPTAGIERPAPRTVVSAS